MLALLLGADATYVLRRRAQVLHVHQVPLRLDADVALDGGDHALRGGEVPGREQHERALAVGAEAVHLAVGVHLVHAAVRARIAGEHQALVRLDGQAVAHDSATRPEVLAISRSSMLPAHADRPESI